jgi:RNA polymerase sigma-70 factor (ECF subfamily)
LIQRSLGGDLDAWGEIVKRYKAAVFGVALGILRHPSDAEDAASDAFIRAYERLNQYDLQRKFSTWIFTIVTNLCKNKLRRDKFTAPLKHVSRVIGGRDPAEIVYQEARDALVQEAIAQLDDKYRPAIILRYYADLDYQEIAQILNLPEGTIKTRLHRAKDELRRILTAKGVTADA